MSKQSERTFTRAQLVEAFTKWEADVREDRSRFRSNDDIAALTVEQAAAESVEAIEAYVDHGTPF